MSVSSNVKFLNIEAFKQGFEQAVKDGCELIYSDKEQTNLLKSAEQFIELSKWVARCSLFIQYPNNPASVIYFECRYNAEHGHHVTAVNYSNTHNQVFDYFGDVVVKA